MYESSSEDEVGASTENSIADLEDLGAMAKEMIAKVATFFLLVVCLWLQYSSSIDITVQ